MKQITTAMTAHLGGEVTTLASCWKLKRRDNTVLGFTDHDQDIVFDGITYKAATGFTPSAIQNSGTLNVDNLDVEGMLSSGSIVELDILSGLYDFAEIEIFLVNYLDVAQGSMKLKRGWLGEVALHKHQFVAEVRGLTQRLSQTIGELYSVSCRATLEDSRCTVDLTSHTVSGSVTSVQSSQQFTDSARGEDSCLFTFGTVSFTGGANSGFSIEVKDYLHTVGTGGIITVALPLPYPVLTGDNYTMVKGCDKTTVTCTGRFNNIINFRGEPHVPGLDRMLETAGTRSS